jgi:electron-transferring-flavoprotein dehydrogenase
VQDGAVVGVRTTPSGRSATARLAAATRRPPTSPRGSPVLCEGTRGPLTQAWLRWQQVGSDNPQIFALGVKELWETKQPLDAVIHTMGWPLPTDAFGGSFCYPLSRTWWRSGLVVGLDYKDATLDVHVLLQKLKQHPLFRPLLEGGEMVEWGAKTIPEGGYYAIPRRRTATAR